MKVHELIDQDYGLSKKMKPSNILCDFGDIRASFPSEYGGKKIEPVIKNSLK